MSKILINSLLLITNVYAGSFVSLNGTFNSTTVPEAVMNVSPMSEPFDIEGQLTKIKSTCLSLQDKRFLTNDTLTGRLARTFKEKLLITAQNAIGYEELRSTLGVLPPGDKWYCGEPTIDWLARGWRYAERAAAPTIEKYYEVVEPLYKNLDINCDWFFKNQLTTGINFLNIQLPSVRLIYRQKFEDYLRRPEGRAVIDKKIVDDLIHDRRNIGSLIDGAVIGIFANKKCCQANEDKCEDKEKIEQQKKLLNNQNF